MDFVRKELDIAYVFDEVSKGGLAAIFWTDIMGSD